MGWTIGEMESTPYIVPGWEPNPEETARKQVEIEQRQAEMAERRVEKIRARRLVLGAGPELKDLEAAAECWCSCHPSPAEPGLHDGGVSCPCQMDPEERRESREALIAMIADLAEYDTGRGARDAAIVELGRELGAEVEIVVHAAPFVVRGVVDGRAFFLRERHDVWRVEIAPDENPLSDPWNADPAIPSICVDAGVIGQLETDGEFSEDLAVRTAVRAVRLFLLRRSCRHKEVPGARFCSTCGVEIARAEEWQVYTQQG